MTTASKAKQSQPVATPAAFFEMPKFDMPSFEMPNFDFAKFGAPQMEVPAAFRQHAEKGVAQAKGAYEKMKAGVEEANGIASATIANASKGATEYGLKLTETARTNTNAAFDFAQLALTVKSLPELLTLSVEHSRKQFEALVSQSKELAALAQKAATDTAAPAKVGFEKAAKLAA